MREIGTSMVLGTKPRVDVRLVGVNAENGNQLLFSVLFIAAAFGRNPHRNHFPPAKAGS
jgi:hypothetical protein